MIIYTVRKSSGNLAAKSDNTERKVSTICILIATVFIGFTLPYALARLIEGTIPPWANFVLIANSGMNSVVYCFRKKCKC